MTRRAWEREEAELQDPSTWDGASGFEQPGNPARRAIVAVPFDREDFAAVVQAARSAGVSTSEFIRAAAVELARYSLASNTSGRVV